MICIGSLALLNNFNRNNYVNFAVEEFVGDKFAGDDVHEIKNAINQRDIKNALQTTHGHVPKFNLKIYEYIYDELVCFPRSVIDYETITTNKFFINVNWLIRGKFHLHHSQITGKIFGYAHYFSNTAQIERSTAKIPLVVDIFFGFDLFYSMKSYCMDMVVKSFKYWQYESYRSKLWKYNWRN